MNELKQDLAIETAKPQLILASNKLSVLFSLAFFLDVGVEFTASGWFSSYAVLTNSMDKAQATICGTLFWTASTFFRFLAAGSSAKCSVKLRWLMIGILVCSVVFLGLHIMGAYRITAIFGSIGFGVTCSAVFPLLMSVPS
jgi:fucose permease